MHLLRSLFPSWRFFDRPGAPYLLEVCWSPPDGHQTHGQCLWEPLYVPPARSWSWPIRLFVNPSGNLSMAWQSLVDRLSQEMDDGDPQTIQNSVVFELIKNGVGQLSGGRSFKIRVVHAGEEVLISPVYTAVEPE